MTEKNKDKLKNQRVFQLLSRLLTPCVIPYRFILWIPL